MKNILVVIGSIQPHEKSVSTRVVQSFLEIYKQNHQDDSIETIDISDVKDIALTRTIMDGKLVESDYKVVENRKKLLEKFKKADIIVVSSPMWNFGLPGHLKEILDTFAVANETFKYLDAPNEKGEIVQALTSGKKLIYIQAMGGINIGEDDIAYLQIKKQFDFIGVKDITYFPVQGTSIPGMSEEEKVTNQVKELANNL